MLNHYASWRPSSDSVVLRVERAAKIVLAGPVHIMLIRMMFMSARELGKRQKPMLFGTRSNPFRFRPIGLMSFSSY